MRWHSIALTAAIGLASGRLVSAAPWCVLSVEEDGGALTFIEPHSKAQLSLPLGAKPHEIAVTVDGKRAFITMFGVRDYDMRIGDPGETIAVIDLSGGAVSARWHLPLANDGVTQLKAPHGIKLRPPSSRELFVNTEMGASAMVVLDANSGDVKRIFPLPDGAHNFVFDDQGEALFVFAGAAGVFKLDPQSGKELAHIALASPVRGLGWTRDHQLLASARGEVVLLAAGDLKLERTMAVPDAAQLFYSIAVDRWLLAPGGPNGKLNVIDAASGTVAHAIDTGRTPIIVQVGPDHRAYVSNVQDDHLTAVDLDTFDYVSLGKLNGPNGLSFGRCPATLLH